jgi:hypothetical protein
VKLGYCVPKGEKAIRIIAPMAVKQHETETADTNDEARVAFKGVSCLTARRSHRSMPRRQDHWSRPASR